MADLSMAQEELETLRVALLSAHYSALDEERALRARLDSGGYANDSEREAVDSGRAAAGLRAFRYQVLLERVMAAQHTDTPDGR